MVRSRGPWRVAPYHPGTPASSSYHWRLQGILWRQSPKVLARLFQNSQGFPSTGSPGNFQELCLPVGDPSLNLSSPGGFNSIDLAHRLCVLDLHV